MDRSWYLRFTVVILAIATAWFALWPSLDGLAADGEDIAMPAPQWVRDVFPGRINPGITNRGRALRVAAA